MSAYRWPGSRQTVLDLNGDVSPGALLNFWVAGTTTPLVVYSDSGLTVPHANIIEASAAGRWPAVFMPYTDYRERVRTAGGTLLWDDDGIANPAPSSEGGGGDVPEAQLLQTGYIMWSLKAGDVTGFVRLNGRTIGNAGSGALERANDDTEDLFVYLWDAQNNFYCPVSGGRGGSGAADFAAGKTLTLPDLRGRAIAGVDTMGTTSAGRLASVSFPLGDSATPGSTAGQALVALDVSQMPAHNHSGSITGPAGAHSHSYLQNPNTTVGAGGGAGAGNTQTGGDTGAVGDHTHALAISEQGGGAAHLNMQPTTLGTYYCKL